MWNCKMLDLLASHILPAMHRSIQRRVRYIASSIRGPVIVVFTTSSSAIIISAPILFCSSCEQNQKNRLETGWYETKNWLKVNATQIQLPFLSLFFQIMNTYICSIRKISTIGIQGAFEVISCSVQYNFRLQKKKQRTLVAMT